MTSAMLTDRPQSGSDGFIIVAVLWILAALATLVSVYAIYVTNSAIAVTTSGDAIIADPLVSAGVELAAYQLISAKKEDRPAVGNFTARVGTTKLTIAFQTEAARIDLNAAPKPLLSGLFAGFGAPPMNADGYADRIIAWRTQAAAGGEGLDSDPETSYYRSAGLTYTPRHGPFVHVDELWLVHGIPPALIERALPYVTVYNGKPTVDVINAAPQVIAALPGMSPQTLQGLLAARASGTLDRNSLANVMGTGNGGEGGAAAATDPGKSFRVGVRVDFDNGRRSAAEAVILLPDDGPVPYRVLSWRTAFDGATDQPQDFGRR
jgi:general secretion pathway protein K